jgi:predicted transposase/invertase (TIGR01784 family)
MTRDDTLWKSILEDLIVHFLRFFFEEADQFFDLNKKVGFLDKEMAEISQAGDLQSPKFVDKLVKVSTRKGKEQWILINIEVQGYKDPHFVERVYIYHYRIFDLYRKQVATMVIFSDGSKNYHPNQYYSAILGTENIFRFKTYKILDQDETELGKSTNPFAFVILTALLAIKKRKKDEGEKRLLQLKIELTRKLLDQQFPKPVIRELYHFIRHYVVFENPENDRIFEKTIDSITDKNKIMGIVEVIRERQIKALREEYIEKGIEQGLEQGKAAFVKNLLKETKFTVAKIASLANVTEDFVEKVKKTLD